MTFAALQLKLAFCVTIEATCRAWKRMSEADHGPGTISTGVTHPSSAVKERSFAFAPVCLRRARSSGSLPHTIAS